MELARDNTDHGSPVPDRVLLTIVPTDRDEDATQEEVALSEPDLTPGADADAVEAVSVVPEPPVLAEPLIPEEPPMVAQNPSEMPTVATSRSVYEQPAPLSLRGSTPPPAADRADKPAAGKPGTSPVLLVASLGGGMMLGGGVVAAIAAFALLFVLLIGGVAGWWLLAPASLDAPVVTSTSPAAEAPVTDSVTPVASAPVGGPEAVATPTPATVTPSAPSATPAAGTSSPAAPVPTPAPVTSATPAPTSTPAAVTPAAKPAPVATPAAPAAAAAPAAPVGNVTVKVITDPPAAGIFVDGDDKGRTPSKLVLEPGSHEIRLESGKSSDTFTIDAAAGQDRFCFALRGKKLAQVPCN